MIFTEELLQLYMAIVLLEQDISNTITPILLANAIKACKRIQENKELNVRYLQIRQPTYCDLSKYTLEKVFPFVQYGIWKCEIHFGCFSFS